MKSIHYRPPAAEMLSQPTAHDYTCTVWHCNALLPYIIYCTLKVHCNEVKSLSPTCRRNAITALTIYTAIATQRTNLKLLVIQQWNVLQFTVTHLQPKCYSTTLALHDISCISINTTVHCKVMKSTATHLQLKCSQSTLHTTTLALHDIAMHYCLTLYTAL